MERAWRNLWEIEQETCLACIESIKDRSRIGRTVWSARRHAAAVHAPDATERVHKAQDVAALDAKLAKAEADIPRSFYNPTVEAGMNSRVDADAPLRTE